MKKVLHQLGLKPWDYEIALRVDQGMSHHDAKSFVVMRWMRAGDFRPLAAMIRKEGLLRGPIVGLLAGMIDTGQLTVKQGRGRPQDPEAFVRDEFAADTYEDFQKYYEVASDDLFECLGSISGVSPESIRQAVTARRRPKK